MFAHHYLFPKLAEAKEEIRVHHRALRFGEIEPPAKPLRPLNPERVALLKESIAHFGVLSPLLVTPLPGGKFLLLDGFHRYQALQELRAEGVEVPQPIPAVVAWADNPNARYLVYALAHQANALRGEEGIGSREYFLALLEQAFGASGVLAFSVALPALKAMQGEGLEAYLDWVLAEGSPVDPTPEDKEGHPAYAPEVRAGIYLLEAVAGRENLPRVLALLWAPPEGPARERRPSPPPGELLEEVRRPSDVKRFLRGALAAIRSEMRGLKLRKRDLARPEVAGLLERVREVLRLLRSLREEGAGAPAPSTPAPPPAGGLPSHLAASPELIEEILSEEPDYGG